MTKRAVITGIGVVAPNGIGTEPYWKATRAGISGLGRISRFDPSKYTTQVAGEVPDFEPSDYVEKRLTVATDRWTHFALAATKLALEDAAVDVAGLDPYLVSVVTAAGSGGNEFGQKEIEALWAKGPKAVSVYQSIAWFYAASTGQISIRHGMKGACGVVASEGAGGLDALGVSRRQIRRGQNVVVAGGTEAPVAPYVLTCQIQTGLLSTDRDPSTAYRPFDPYATGYVPGEGGAIVIVEELEHAREREAPHLHAEIAGYGATQDGHHHSEPAPDGHQYARAMSRALEDAGVEPDAVDAVFVDGMGHPIWDRIEVRALEMVFGDRLADIPATAPKTMVGRLYSGGGALDVATAALAIRDGAIPPTIGTTEVAGDIGLDLVRDASREAELSTVLVAARGFGGFNSAVVLRRVQA